MDAAVVVLATADEERRAPVLRELTRAGFAVLTEASWEGLTRQVSQPGRGLALIDPELPELRPALLIELAASLPRAPALFALAPCPHLPVATSAQLLTLARRHAAPLIDADERKELRLMGLGPDALDLLQSAARSPQPVALEGERGTGKRRLARLLHSLSGRPGPMETPEGDLLAARPSATPGTWYLPRLDDLDEVTFTTLASRAARHGQGLVCATRRPLSGQRGIGLTPLRLRPLRERPDELRELATLYLERYQRRLGLPRRRPDKAFWALLRQYPWPGNVRELEAFAVQALTSTSGPTLRGEELPPRVRALVELGDRPAAFDEAQSFEELVEHRLGNLLEGLPPGAALDLHTLVVESTERALLRLVLTRTAGNQKAAAQMLGLARNTLHAKALHLGLITAKPKGGR